MHNFLILIFYFSDVEGTAFVDLSRENSTAHATTSNVTTTRELSLVSPVSRSTCPSSVSSVNSADDRDASGSSFCTAGNDHVVSDGTSTSCGSRKRRVSLKSNMGDTRERARKTRRISDNTDTSAPLSKPSLSSTMTSSNSTASEMKLITDVYESLKHDVVQSIIRETAGERRRRQLKHAERLLAEQKNMSISPMDSSAGAAASHISPVETGNLTRNSERSDMIDFNKNLQLFIENGVTTASGMNASVTVVPMDCSNNNDSNDDDVNGIKETTSMNCIDDSSKVGGDEEYLDETARNSFNRWFLSIFPRLSGSVLSHVKGEIPGVTAPMLYYGMLFSTFCWHVEDNWLSSISYNHYGAAKTW